MARNTAHHNKSRQDGMKLLFGIAVLMMLSVVWQSSPVKPTRSPTAAPTLYDAAVVRAPRDRPKPESLFNEDELDELDEELESGPIIPFEEWPIAVVPPPGPPPRTSHPPDRKPVRLLVYNELEWHLNSPGTGECSVQCQVTYERDEYGQADVVLFSAPFLDVETMDDLAKPKLQFWVALCMGHKSDEQCKRLHADLNGRIDLISSYKPLADIPAFFYVPPAPILWRPPPVVGTGVQPPEIAALLSSTCSKEAEPERFELLTGLIKHLANGVASYGECFHTAELPDNSEEFDISDLEYSEFAFAHTRKVISAVSQHKFLLVFENHDSPYYHTEKFWLAYQAGVVPVYWGNPTIKKGKYGAGPSSFVYARDFSKAKDLAHELERIAADDQLYQSYFRWRNQSATIPFNYHKENDVSNLACNICKKVVQEEEERDSSDEEDS